jgi:transposase
LDKLFDDASITKLFSVQPELLKSFQLTHGMKNVLMDASANLKGSARRTFMAKTVITFGKGGQRRAEQELKWDRKTICKGMREYNSGMVCVDNFSGRGRKPAQEHLPSLLENITTIVRPTTQADPTFRTTQIYTPLTAKTVRTLLIEEKGYRDNDLPTMRTILAKLNYLNFHPQKVAKTKPLKKIEQTDAIFEQVHKINREADEIDGILRLSMDAKAKVYVGPLSRGGKSRQGERASDHDYDPDDILTPFGIYLPVSYESFFYFTRNNVTADFMVDCLQSLWSIYLQRLNLHTLVINVDNGPENNSHRTQFIKRIVDFAHTNSINVKLAYYPPYHSKYNPIERVWGVLEKHWNGEILYAVDKVLGLARTMTYNSINPVVELVEKNYSTGIKLTKKAMVSYEEKIIRMKGLERWFVDVPVIQN